MFGLTDLERQICLFFVILSVYEEAQSLFEFHLKCDGYAGRPHLATILKSTPSEIWNALHGKLSRIGILNPDRRSVSMESDFLRFLQGATEADISTEFFKKIEVETLPLDAHNVEPEVTDHALRLLSPENDKGCALLLYGNPGVGKTTFAYGLGKELGLDMFLCKHEGKAKSWERQAAVMASVNMVSQNKKSLLIIDDCDSLLGTRHLWSLFGAYNDKKWVHDVLESDAKIIFIVNDVQFLEESVIRRFSFSIHFKPFSRGQRIQLWKNILQDHKIGLAFTDAQISLLASRHDVSPGVIEQAVRTAAEIAPESNVDLYERITIALQAHESLSHGGHVPTRPQTVDTNFVLDGLHVIGTDLTALLNELEAFSEHLRNSDSDDAAGVALLFHGPSGTGKSHLGRYIASRLDREAVVKRGSDLLSPFVGETEQRIRSAYEEAAAKDAVLIIDEAESLVLNRDRAQHSWEMSFTNEFLNCMEEFTRGIQIFTTNRPMDLDSASLRRFTYKLAFGYLEPSAAVTLYKKILSPLVGTELEDILEAELKSLACLAPGDFKVVRSQFRFKASGEVSHDSLIAALKEEAKVKEIHAGQKAIGF